MNKKIKKIAFRWLIRLGVLFCIGLIVGAVVLVRNMRSIYNFSHLLPDNDFGPAVMFTPVGESWEGMATAIENDILTLYVCPGTAVIAVRDNRNGFVWHSNPVGGNTDPNAIEFERGIMRSPVGISYYDAVRRRRTKWAYMDAAQEEQFTLYSIPNGLRVVYQMGNMSLGIDAVPVRLTNERFEERVLAQIEDDSDVLFVRRHWLASREHEGFMEMMGSSRAHAINSQIMVRIFEDIGYTLDELYEDNNIAGIELDISFSTFTVIVEYMLDGDTLVVNLPLSEFQTSDNTALFNIDLMRYFGAGSMDEEGYIFVPSGSGALIKFNNGKLNDDPFSAPVFGPDPLLASTIAQIIEPIRLPVLGIKRENAAMVAHVVSGAGMAFVNADIAGRLSSFNTSWFNFLIRNEVSMSMPGGWGMMDLTITQEHAYESDITVRYTFLANADATYVGMALAYQQHLVDTGVLTPLTAADDIPFYLTVIGAAEQQRRTMGVPHSAIIPMTTFQQGEYLLELLNAEGVNHVNMRWQGWFNGGINHTVAKNISTIRAIGNRNDLHNLNMQLQAGGGGLFPSVNFITVNQRSRNLSTAFEAARNPAGFIGYQTTFNREFLSMTATLFENNWFVLVNPGVLPFHLDSFIPEYERLDIDNLALDDLGGVLTQSIFRRHFIDRESSRLVITDQLERLNESFDNIMISGGNHYSWGVASHLVDIPLEKNRHYIFDVEIPFLQIVIRGFIDYAGMPINVREVQNQHRNFLQLMATGAAPHYMWSYSATINLEHTPFASLYSTWYRNWFDIAVEEYHAFNAVFRDLRTQRIVGHQVLHMGNQTSPITVTVYEDGTRIYVNTTNQPFTHEGVTIPAMDYKVVRP